jgi:hypothetical protein
MIFRIVFAAMGLSRLAVMALAFFTSSAAAAGCVGINYVEGSGGAAREAACLRELARSAQRHGDLLTLRFDNGAARTWRSNPKACAEDDAAACVRYALIGYHPLARVIRFWHRTTKEPTSRSSPRRPARR